VGGIEVARQLRVGSVTVVEPEKDETPLNSSEVAWLELAARAAHRASEQLREEGIAGVNARFDFPCVRALPVDAGGRTVSVIWPFPRGITLFELARFMEVWENRLLTELDEGRVLLSYMEAMLVAIEDSKINASTLDQLVHATIGLAKKDESSETRAGRGRRWAQELVWLLTKKESGLSDSLAQNLQQALERHASNSPWMKDYESRFGHYRDEWLRAGIVLTEQTGTATELELKAMKDALDGFSAVAEEQFLAGLNRFTGIALTRFMTAIEQLSGSAYLSIVRQLGDAIRPAVALGDFDKFASSIWDASRSIIPNGKTILPAFSIFRGVGLDGRFFTSDNQPSSYTTSISVTFKNSTISTLLLNPYHVPTIRVTGPVWPDALFKDLWDATSDSAEHGHALRVGAMELMEVPWLNDYPKTLGVRNKSAPWLAWPVPQWATFWQAEKFSDWWQTVLDNFGAIELSFDESDLEAFLVSYFNVCSKILQASSPIPIYKFNMMDARKRPLGPVCTEISRTTNNLQDTFRGRLLHRWVQRLAVLAAPESGLTPSLAQDIKNGLSDAVAPSTGNLVSTNPARLDDLRLERMLQSRNVSRPVAIKKIEEINKIYSKQAEWAWFYTSSVPEPDSVP